MSKETKTGVFYTKKPFVDLAHEYLSNVYGEDWKERFIVWDNCAGGLNLTKEYQFKELYISTLEHEDIERANDLGLNPEAVKFQYDFLNDSDNLIPQSLRDALISDKEILFLMNPPYVAATNINNVNHKGLSFTVVGDEMRKLKLGKSASQLSLQFMYRIMKWAGFNRNIHIAVFNSPQYLTGQSAKTFRRYFFNTFGYAKGFLFSAGHFENTSNAWGVSFSIWKPGLDSDKNDFIHDLYDLEDDVPIKFGEKTLYNLDQKESANEFFMKWA